MELLKVDGLENAINKLYDEYVNNGVLIDKEVISVSDALNRVIFDDITSNIDVPDFNRSVVDGYAVISSDLSIASETVPSFLKIIGESKMGEACNLAINSGECVYVPTGAMLPKNADAVVMVEHIENITSDKIAVYESVNTGKSVVRKADDIKKNELVFNKGKRLSYADIGLLSSIGINKISVYKKWNISIISTGDELIDDINDYEIGKVLDINSNLINSLCIKYGFNVVNKYLLKDNEKVLEETIKNCMKDSDVVIISGGSSKGKKDATSNIIDKISSSKVITHGIAIKPGKPTITGFDKISNTLLIGLPGHPVASAILFRHLVIGVYKKIVADTSKDKYIYGIINTNLPASPGRKTIQLVNVDEEGNVSPIFGRSGLIHTLSKANGYIVLDDDLEGINKGDEVKVYYL